MLIDKNTKVLRSLGCLEAVSCQKMIIHFFHDFDHFSYFSQNLVISPTVRGTIAIQTILETSDSCNAN